MSPKISSAHACVCYLFGSFLFPTTQNKIRPNFKLIIKNEIKPLLELLERLRSKEDEESFFRSKNEIQILFRNGLSSLQDTRKNAEEQMLNLTSKIEKYRDVEVLSVVCGLIGFGSLLLPHVFVGLSLIAAGFIGVGFGYRKIKVHKETMSLLEETRKQLLEVETTIGRANTDVEIYFDGALSFPDLKESLKDLQSRIDQLQLQDSKEDSPLLVDKL